MGRAPPEAPVGVSGTPKGQICNSKFLREVGTAGSNASWIDKNADRQKSNKKRRIR